MMKPGINALICAMSVCLFSYQAIAASVEEILEEAFDSPTGNVNAPFDGQTTNMASQTAPSRGDLRLKVMTIENLEQKDCRRFFVLMKAMSGKGSGSGEPIPSPTIEIDYCKGGEHPKEGGNRDSHKKLIDQMNAYARERAAKTPASHIRK